MTYSLSSSLNINNMRQSYKSYRKSNLQKLEMNPRPSGHEASMPGTSLILVRVSKCQEILGAGRRGQTLARCSTPPPPSTDPTPDQTPGLRTQPQFRPALRRPTGRPSRASTALAAVLFLRVTLMHLTLESSALNFDSSAFAEKQTFRNASVSNQVSSIESRTLFFIWRQLIKLTFFDKTSVNFFPPFCGRKKSMRRFYLSFVTDFSGGQVVSAVGS